MNAPIYPREMEEEITLADGARVLLRPLRAEDAPLLQEGFSRLSKESIYLRFLETFRQLSDAQAQALANVDYRERMALVGVIQEDGQDRLVAVARYAVLDRPEPGLAETGIVVRDDYQHRGLGKIIMIRLVQYARQHGVQAFIATVHVSNQRILHFITASGLSFERHMLEPGVWEIQIPLDEVHD
jgi:acetyltransferase